jgi:AcrR family transcriptional regulator
MTMQSQASRHARSRATQDALMRAAEKLIAERGIENVSIRDIVAEAGQKNESALQYHFKTFTGLITAIHGQRSAEIQAMREELLKALLAQTRKPTLRELCILMVKPAFDLARSHVDFRRYIKAFGHELALTESSALSRAVSHGAGGPSGQQMAGLLKRALPHLDEDAYGRRMETAVRLCSASMVHQARQRNAFRGDQADLFFHSLIDALEGLLSAPVSNQTREAAAAIRQRTS